MRLKKKPHGPKLLFVNSVDDPQQARVQNRRLVHSHVSQYRWKRSREAEEHSNPSDNVRSNTNTRISGQAEEQHRGPRIVGSAACFPSHQTQDPLLLYSDPFFPAQQALNAMSYVSQTMLPGLFLHEKTGQAWVPAAVSDPVLFSACMYGAVVHMLRRLDGHSAESDQHAVWQINNETIRRLHRILDDHTRASSDGAIFAVLALAYSAQLQAAPLNTDPHPRRPLQDLQWLTVYSSLPTNLLHVQGLETLVGMRGGLGQITLPGLAPLLSYLCMLRASRLLTRPVLPFVPLSDAHQKLEEMIMMGGHASPIDPHILNNELFPRMPRNILQILTRIYQYNEMLARYLGGSIGAPKMTDFADQRNWIQRAILALPWSDEVEIPADSTFSRFEHEMVRVSLLLYSFLVVFPIPFAYGPYDRMLEMLKNILVNDEAALNPLPKSVVLWAASLGAITSESVASDDAWFVAKLRELTSQGGVTASWNDYKLAVRSVLWQDSVLDPFMQRIWLSHILVV